MIGVRDEGDSIGKCDSSKLKEIAHDRHYPNIASLRYGSADNARGFAQTCLIDAIKNGDVSKRGRMKRFAR